MTTATTYQIAAIASVVVFVLLGTILIFLGVRGRLALIAARCGKCGYQIAPESASNGACAECGDAFNSPSAVRYGIRKARKKMVVLGCIALACSVLIPMAIDATRSLGQTLATKATASATPTWLLPVDQTPDMPYHQAWELQDVPTNQLLEGLSLRPADEGLWGSIGERASRGELTNAQAIDTLERVTAIHLGHDLNTYFGSIGNATQAIAGFMFSVLDPADANDRAVAASFVAAVMPLPTHHYVQAHTETRLYLSRFDWLPTGWAFDIQSLNLTLNDTPIPFIKLRSNNWRATFPPLAPPTGDTSHILKFAANIVFTPENDAEGQSFELRPTLDIPLTVVPSGQTAVKYNEDMNQPVGEIFKKTTATVWTPEGENGSQYLSILFSPSIKAAFAAKLGVVPLIDGATFIDGGTNILNFQGHRGSMTSSSSLLKTYRLDTPLTTRTINVDLEPKLEVLPYDGSKKADLIGARVHLRNIPVTNLDDEDESASILTKLTATTSTVGGDPSTLLFGPSPLLESTTERTAALIEWLAIRIGTFTHSNGIRWVQCQFGSASPPPFNARLVITIGAMTRMIDAKTGGGKFWIRPVESVDETADTLRVTLQGFPGCVRRDQPTPYFGGSCTLDVPVQTGIFNQKSNRIEVVYKEVTS